jgi:hypothetical protein
MGGCMLSEMKAAGCIPTPDVKIPYLVVSRDNLSQPDSLVTKCELRGILIQRTTVRMYGPLPRHFPTRSHQAMQSEGSHSRSPVQVAGQGFKGRGSGFRQETFLQGPLASNRSTAILA